MADTKISALSAGTAAPGDEIPVNRGGSNFKITAGDILKINGGTITADSPVLNLTQTWNDAAVTFTGLKFNADGSSSTNSASGSLLMDLLVGGSTKFNVDKTGKATVTAVLASSTSGLSIAVSSTTNAAFVANNLIRVGNAGSFQFAASGSPGGTADLYLFRDAAGIFAQRNSTNAQTFRIYNTYTDASNYERGIIDWNTAANEFHIAAENAGTGTARLIKLRTNSILVFQAGGYTCKIIAGAFERNSSNYEIKWGTTTNAQTGITSDTGLARSAAAVVKVTDGSTGNGAIQFAHGEAKEAYTVATLPGTPAVGMIARVTDASAPAVGSTVSGGGAAAALCWYNGANWTVIGV